MSNKLTSNFTRRLNLRETYHMVRNERIEISGGSAEVYLKHGNVDEKSLVLFTGLDGTGIQIKTFLIEKPSLEPWKSIVKIFTNEPIVYATYRTIGDQVDANDINTLQVSVEQTQALVNNFTDTVSNHVTNQNIHVTTQDKANWDGKETVSGATTKANDAREQAINFTKDYGIGTNSKWLDSGTNLNSVEINGFYFAINPVNGPSGNNSGYLIAQQYNSTQTSQLFIHGTTGVISYRVKSGSTWTAWSTVETTSGAISKVSAHTSLTNNPHNVTAAQINTYTKPESDAKFETIINVNNIKQQLETGITNARAYTDSKVAELINNAPAVLDTLNELSKALGDDPNFATTISNEVGTKADKTVVDGHILNVNNPHNVTKQQIGLGNVDNVSQASKTEFDQHKNDNIIHITANDRIAWGNKAEKTTATQTQDGLISKDDKIKLDNISSQAKRVESSNTNGNIRIDGSETIVYTHPTTHPATIIVQDTNNRFVTDTQITTWNAKENAVSTGTTAQYYRGDKTWQTLNSTTVGLGNVTNESKATMFTSPTFTGTPAAPTATTGTNTTQIATTAFVTAGDVLQVSKAGDTMTGLLTLSGTPTANLHAATKQYVDTTTTPSGHVGATGTAHGVATTSVAGFMSPTDKTKLDGVAANANNYAHPANHPASVITQDANNRFVTDTEKNTWSGKQDNLGYTPINKAGDTVNGKLTLPASTVSGAPLNIPHGADPTTLANGDIWTTTSAPRVHINGTTRTIYHDGNAGTAALTTATQAEAEAGTSTTVRAWTSQRIGQAISAKLPTKVSDLTNDANFVTSTQLSNFSYGDMSKAVYDINNNGKVDIAETAENVPWTGISGRPTTFTPSVHTHSIADITNLQTSLDAKSNTTHTHELTNLTDVTITTATSGQFIRYNGTLWVNTLLVAADIPNLDVSKITTGTFAAARLPSGTTAAAGIVQLNNTTNSTLTTQAATANAVKLAMDRAVEAENNAKAYADTVALGGVITWNKLKGVL